jgi:hypothetical protein
MNTACVLRVRLHKKVKKTVSEKLINLDQIYRADNLIRDLIILNSI